MKSYSLRLRLLAGAAVAIFVSLAIAWFALSVLFGHQLEERAEEELRRNALLLVSGLGVDASGSLVVSQPPTDPRFLTPASGLYWQISNSGETQRSRSLWDQALASSENADSNKWRTRFVDGPFGHRLFLLERFILPQKSQDRVLVQLALDEEDMRRARTEFGAITALFLVLLGLALAVAAWVQVHLGLQPLAHLRHDLTLMLGSAAQRLKNSYPREVEPLTRTINELAAAREADVKRARQRAADLAHGMKTPIAALSAQSRLIREGVSDPRHAADGLDRAIAAAAAAVEGELARARAAENRLGRYDALVSPRLVAERLILVLERTDKGMRLDYTVDVPADLRLAVSGEDLNEILGPLLENAVRYARRQVHVTGYASGEAIMLSVEDDGPGIDAEAMSQVMKRGARLDEAGSGHGLGLAISRQLVEATDGSISLGVSPLGGLRVELRWPVGIRNSYAG